MLPTSADLGSLDFVYRGAPFCEVSQDASLDATYRGAPWGRNLFAAAGPAVLHFVLDVTATLEGRTFTGTLAGDLTEL